MEQWKDISEFEGSYQVSNTGKVRSLSRFVKYKHGGKDRYWPGKIISPFNTKSGYLNVTLKISNRNHHRQVHRLVAAAFVGAFNARDQVNHKDGDKHNNNYDNLEIVTQSENMKHAFTNGLHSGVGSTHYKAKKITDGVHIWGTLKEAGDYFGVSRKVIHDRINNRVKNINNLRYIE